MSLLSDVISPSKWRDEPLAQTAKTAACVVGGPICLGLELVERPQREQAAREDQARREAERARAQRSGLQNLLDDARGAVRDTLGDITNAATSGANTLERWGQIAAVIVFSILGIVVLVTAAYFALPILTYLKS